MQVFSYTVRSLSGERREGLKQGVSSNEVASWLREQGYVPISVEEVATEKKNNGKKLLPGRIKSSDLSAIYWQLTTMLESGVPVATALGTITEDIENPRLQGIMKEVLAKVNKGEPLSAGIADYPRIFNLSNQSNICPANEFGRRIV